jgi:crossover junction endodeoxyribonuclease RuvC
MLQCNESRFAAAPTQLAQLVVNGVTRAHTRARTVQTKRCDSCVSSLDFRGFRAGSGVAGSVQAPEVGHRAGGAVRPAIEGRDDAGLPPNVGPGRAAALSLLEAGHAPASDPLRLQQHVVLALDLGQKTGWAVRNTDGAIASGTVEFKPGRFEGGGMIYLRFRAWLQEVDETAGGICAVYFEEVRFHRGVTAAHAYAGYLAHLTAWAEMFKIPYRGVPVGTIKRHVTGRGNADKDAVIAAVRALGFDPVDDNEADALALLDWALKVGGRQ